MEVRKLLAEVRDNLDTVIAHDSPMGESLWQAFLDVHPVDIADFITTLDKDHFRALFGKFPDHIQQEVFRELSEPMKVVAIESVDVKDQLPILHGLPVDELTDLFEHFSDEQLKRYLNLLHTKDRNKILSLLQFDPESAGGIMDTEVFTLMSDFTVEKSIHVLQRLRPSRDIHQQVYIVSRSNQLEGYINLQDLVLQKPHMRIAEFMHKPELIVRADEDQEKVANKMVHYGVMTVPVVDAENHFLGVIPSDTLVDVIVEEASEDVQRMAALAPLKYPYFETSFFRLFYERASILVVLLLFGSISSGILHAYEALLGGLLLALVPMLTSTGGNASNQTSAMVIQGIASGEIDYTNVLRFLRRELLMAILLGIVLGLASYGRVWFTGGSPMESVAVSLAVSMIVITSVALGSGVPIVLKRFNIDPAFSAGPFLATAMDILGVIIYTVIVKLLLS